MCELLRTQEHFSAALKSTGSALPDLFKRTSGASMDKRFDVYRNNIRSSLVEALKQTFPVIERVVGPDYFKALAIAFLENNLPVRATLIGFGDGFPEFLDSVEGLHSLPYIADVARLEHAWLNAYNAADVRPLTGGDLASVPSERLQSLSLRPHPSLTLLSCELPVHEIWQKNRDGDTSPIRLQPVREHLLIFRPRIDVIVTSIQAGEMAFLEACEARKTLEAAYEAGLESNPAFDLAEALAGFVAQGLFASFDLEDRI